MGFLTQFNSHYHTCFFLQKLEVATAGANPIVAFNNALRTGTKPIVVFNYALRTGTKPMLTFQHSFRTRTKLILTF